MGRITTIGLADVLNEIKEKKKLATDEFQFNENIGTDVAEIHSAEAEQLSVSLDDTDVEAIDLDEIRDVYGRISDLIEALEDDTGMSVIPLEMGHIAPEIVSLQRHEIMDFNGKRVAMSHRIRDNVIDSFKERIIKTLSTGLPFKESLNVIVTHAEHDYETLALSKDEWTRIMAMFRHYKERLIREADGKYYLEILPDRKE